ncbi:chemotaxis protein CheW, partial [bacterium]|nr:chemotaxis protein CheW [bacterium]
GVLTGMIVDDVLDIVGIDKRDIEPASPALGHTGFLIGVGRVEGTLIILVDPDKLLSVDEASGHDPIDDSHGATGASGTTDASGATHASGTAEAEGRVRHGAA